MGLDSYLFEEEYLSEYLDKERHAEVCEALGRDDVKTISYEVGYWRKANQIHHWFVENVQDGVDECQKSYVSRENLKQLYDTCKEVLEVAQVDDTGEIEYMDNVDGKWVDVTEPARNIVNTSTVHAVMPTSSGFFFGGTDYDEWYLRDIENTIEILEKLRNEDGTFGRKGYDYYYRSSW
jgi:hypothetical protein